LRRHKSRLPVDEFAVGSDQQRIAEAEPRCLAIEAAISRT
jgi:hypothetical protein